MSGYILICLNRIVLHITSLLSAKIYVDILTSSMFIILV